ncbi:MAG: hypothetical protein R2747_17855 [Pyrinomonadaceae bacterium]
MKLKLFLCLLSLVLTVSSCQMLGGAKEADDKGNTEAKKEDPAKPEDKKEEKPENAGPVKFPIDGFVIEETTAKAGEYVLVPSYNWLTDAQEKGLDKVTMIFYAQKMDTPGKEMSKVKFMSDSHDVPNAYIIPIPAGQTAKKGDILLTWWQSGSGMNRAIVTDDSDPKRPVVRYLDIAYDNPAKSRDKTTTIGQMDEQLKPDTFVKISGPMQPGSATAIQDGGDLKHGLIISMTDDKVYVKQFAGKTGVYDRDKCQGVPLVPDVKAGDTVKAERFGKFSSGIVSRVDPKIGRVFIKFDGSQDEKAIPFGDVMK